MTKRQKRERDRLRQARSRALREGAPHVDAFLRSEGIEPKRPPWWVRLLHISSRSW